MKRVFGILRFEGMPEKKMQNLVLEQTAKNLRRLLSPKKGVDLKQQTGFQVIETQGVRLCFCHFSAQSGKEVRVKRLLQKQLDGRFCYFVEEGHFFE